MISRKILPAYRMGFRITGRKLQLSKSLLAIQTPLLDGSMVTASQAGKRHVIADQLRDEEEDNI